MANSKAYTSGQGKKLGLFKDKEKKEDKAKPIESQAITKASEGSGVQRVANREATRVKLTHAKPRYKK